MTLEACIENRLHHRRIIDLLRVIDLVAARHAARVVVGDVGMEFLDPHDQVALHDLHVIDVVEQLESFGADAFAQFHAPLGVVALVVLVIHPAVEQLHDDGDVCLFGGGHDALQAQRTILDALFVVESGAVAGEANQVGETRFGYFFDPPFIRSHETVVVLNTIPCLLDAAQSLGDRIGDHCASKSVLFQGGKIRRVEQFNGLQSHPFPGHAKILQADFWITPFADRVMDAALERATHRRFGCGQAASEGNSGCGNRRAAGDVAKSCTAGNAGFHGNRDFGLFCDRTRNETLRRVNERLRKQHNGLPRA